MVEFKVQVKESGGINVELAKVKQSAPVQGASISTVVRLVHGLAKRVMMGVMVAVVKQVGLVVLTTVDAAVALLLLTDRHGHVSGWVVDDVDSVVIVVSDVDSEDSLDVDVSIDVELKVKSVVKKVDDVDGRFEVVDDVVIDDVVVVVRVPVPVVPLVRLVGSSLQVELQPQF